MASITITTTAAQDARLAPAYESILNLGRPAAAADVKAYLITVLQADVRNYENVQAQLAIVTSAFTPT